MKECSKCGEIKDVNRFSQNNGFKDGLNITCKDCINKKNKERYRKKHPLIEKHKSKEGFKFCVKCQTEKSKDQFYGDKKCSDGLYSYCKECACKNSIISSNKRTEKNRHDRKYGKVEYYHDWHCGCGCNEPLRILPSHSVNGIPKYILGHESRTRKRKSKYQYLDFKKDYFCECAVVVKK